MKPPPKLDPYGFCYYQQLIAVKCGDKTGRQHIEHADHAKALEVKAYPRIQQYCLQVGL